MPVSEGFTHHFLPTDVCAVGVVGFMHPDKPEWWNW